MGQSSGPSWHPWVRGLLLPGSPAGGDDKNGSGAGKAVSPPRLSAPQHGLGLLGSFCSFPSSSPKPHGARGRRQGARRASSLGLCPPGCWVCGVLVQRLRAELLCFSSQPFPVNFLWSGASKCKGFVVFFIYFFIFFPSPINMGMPQLSLLAGVNPSPSHRGDASGERTVPFSPVQSEQGFPSKKINQNKIK